MVNEVTLIGNVGKDPEAKGESVVTFSLATEDNYKSKETGEWVNNTDWHNCVIFGERGKTLLSKVQKGMTLYVQGKIKYRKYEANGETKWSTSIQVGNWRILKGNNVGGGSASEEPDTTDEDDSLPF